MGDRNFDSNDDWAQFVSQTRSAMFQVGCDDNDPWTQALDKRIELMYNKQREKDKAKQNIVLSLTIAASGVIATVVGYFLR